MQTNRRYGAGVVSKQLGRGAAIILAALAAAAQNVSRDGVQWTPAARGPHETRWELLEREPTPLGREGVRTRSYVELATSLNFFNETTQQWEPSREEWQVYPEGIVAQAGRHKVILATANVTLGGCVEVDVLTPDGVRLTCAPVGLGLYDPVDGKQVVLAEVKPDCKPERGAAPNEILFRDCFDRVRGSIRFLYNLAGVRQHGAHLDTSTVIDRDFDEFGSSPRANRVKQYNCNKGLWIVISKNHAPCVRSSKKC